MRRSAANTPGFRLRFIGASDAGCSRVSSSAAPSTTRRTSSRTMKRPPGPTCSGRSLDYDRLRLARALPDHADLVDRLAARAQRFRRALGILRCDDHHHPDTAVEDAEHLVLCDAARLLQPLEHRRARPGVLSNL